MIKIALFGAAGRMGRAVISALDNEKDIRIIHAVDVSRKVGEKIGSVILEGDLDAAEYHADVWVDVSLPKPTLEHAEKANRLQIPILIGTTGFDSREMDQLQRLRVAHIISPNLSPGINLLFEAVPLMRKILGEKFDVAVSEIHHRYKVDAPSGTAIRLKERLESISVNSLSGSRGISPVIQVTSLRLGEIVGEHRILLVSEGEEIEIIHRAHSRMAFASGVAPAVRFLAGKKEGTYTMADVLGIKWQES